jgi:hypothetical protein
MDYQAKNLYLDAIGRAVPDAPAVQPQPLISTRRSCWLMPGDTGTGCGAMLPGT